MQTYFNKQRRKLSMGMLLILCMTIMLLCTACRNYQRRMAAISAYVDMYRDQIEEDFGYGVKIEGNLYGQYSYRMNLLSDNTELDNDQYFKDVCEILAFLYENIEADNSEIESIIQIGYVMRVTIPQIEGEIKGDFQFIEKKTKEKYNRGDIRTDIFCDYTPVGTMGIDYMYLAVDAKDFSEEQINELRSKYKENDFIITILYPTGATEDKKGSEFGNGDAGRPPEKPHRAGGEGMDHAERRNARGAGQIPGVP